MLNVLSSDDENVIPHFDSVPRIMQTSSLNFTLQENFKADLNLQFFLNVLALLFSYGSELLNSLRKHGE
jgi:hypothetical protein